MYQLIKLEINNELENKINMTESSKDNQFKTLMNIYFHEMKMKTSIIVFVVFNQLMSIYHNNI